MTLINVAAEIVDKVRASLADGPDNQTTTVAGVLRDRLPVIEPELKQCCGCHAIWQLEKIQPHNVCPHCGGQCGGLRIML